jgi:hypothetical protein
VTPPTASAPATGGSLGSNVTVFTPSESVSSILSTLNTMSQASPMRDVVINGNVTLMDYCDGSPDYASGGFIANSQITGTVTNGSQQQYYVRNTDIGSWSNAVWNQVFSGDPGAPAQSFAANSGDSGGPESYTTLSTTPASEEEPFLYTNSAGAYEVFVPSLQANSTARPGPAGPSRAARCR